MNNIYPYEPTQGYKFVPIINPFMQAAMRVAKEQAFDNGFNPQTPIGIVLVKNSVVIVEAVSGSNYHREHGCERTKLGIANGEYEKCPGCSYLVHAEQNAVRKAIEKNIDIIGADAYLFGHFWYCESCCNLLKGYNIVNLYLLNDAHLYFDKSSPNCKRTDYQFFIDLINNLK